MQCMGAGAWCSHTQQYSSHSASAHLFSVRGTQLHIEADSLQNLWMLITNTVITSGSLCTRHSQHNMLFLSIRKQTEKCVFKGGIQVEYCRQSQPRTKYETKHKVTLIFVPGSVYLVISMKQKQFMWNNLSFI